MLSGGKGRTRIPGSWRRTSARRLFCVARGAREVLPSASGRARKLVGICFGSRTLPGDRRRPGAVFHPVRGDSRGPLVLAGVVLLTLLPGVVATWIPAWRVLSIDPVTLLREQVNRRSGNVETLNLKRDSHRLGDGNVFQRPRGCHKTPARTLVSSRMPQATPKRRFHQAQTGGGAVKRTPTGTSMRKKQKAGLVGPAFPLRNWFVALYFDRQARISNSCLNLVGFPPLCSEFSQIPRGLACSPGLRVHRPAAVAHITIARFSSSCCRTGRAHPAISTRPAASSAAFGETP